MNTNRSESVRIVSVPRDYLHQSFSIGKGRYGSVYKINHQELDQEDFLYAAKHCRFDVEGMFRHWLPFYNTPGLLVFMKNVETVPRWQKYIRKRIECFIRL